MGSGVEEVVYLPLNVFWKMIQFLPVSLEKMYIYHSPPQKYSMVHTAESIYRLYGRLNTLP